MTMGGTGNAERVLEASLQQVIALRSVIIFTFVIGLWTGNSKLGINLPVEPILLGIGVLVATSVTRMLRMRAVVPFELFVELCMDLFALTGIMYWSGGISNPFVSFYLVLLTVGAMLLPPRLGRCLAALVIGLYTFLIFYYRPMIHRHDPTSGAYPVLDLHSVGAWMTFALSALIVAILLVKMVEGTRERERRLAAMREENLRNERIIALGAFAAGTAHELGTPLSTIATIAKELEHRVAKTSEMHGMLQTLRTQVDVCKHHLTGLTQHAGVARSENCGLLPADTFISEVLQAWRVIRPEAKFEFLEMASDPPPNILTEPTLKQALICVLNNAADVSPKKIEVQADWNASKVVFEILDSGPGLNDHILQKVGQTVFSTKMAKDGMGIGLYLARAALERFGGSLSLANRAGGGVKATIIIPVN